MWCGSKRSHRKKFELDGLRSRRTRRTDARRLDGKKRDLLLDAVFQCTRA